MFSIISFICFAIIQKAFAQESLGYVLDSEGPLVLEAANLRLISFRLLKNWVDFTLEYRQTSGSTGADAQWFGIGFGNDQMHCTYAVTFEPKLDIDNESISSVTITERQLGNHESGRELDRSFSYIETTIENSPLVVIRSRLVRPRVVEASPTTDEECNSINPSGYYEFPFNEEDISIIYAKGVNGALSVSYHTSPNRNISTIPLRSATDSNVSIPTNTTTVVPTCPKPFALSNYSYDERFNSPIIGRVCGSCSNDFNATSMPSSTGIPLSTGISLSTGIIPISTNIIGISSLEVDDLEASYQCFDMSGENETFPEVCGCANELSPDVSIVFLVDGAGNQNDSDWEQFTWKILEGFFMDVMLTNLNISANFTNWNETMNNTILDDLDVNVVIYGGSSTLQVHKLTWAYLQNISTDPIPKEQRHISNLCEATSFASTYLMDSNRSSKILVTIPWQDASDELYCLTCNECLMYDIHTFTAKVFDQVDLSLVESTYGGYSNCTYLYDNETEAENNHHREWPYVLAGISDFICITSKPVPVNFSLDLLMVSRLPASILNTYLNNISDLIEEAFENASNYSLEAGHDFSVECLSVNESDIEISLPSIEGPMFTVMIDNVVHCANKEIKDILIALAKGPAFSNLINNSFYNYFERVNGDAIVYVYSVNNQTIFNLTEFTSTSMFPMSTSTSIFEINSTFISPTKDTGDDIVDKARRFVMRLVPWMIALIVIGAVILCMLMVGLCALCCKRRNSEKEDIKDKEQMPMIVTNTVASRYLENTKSGHNKQNVTHVPDEDDQVYV